MLVTSPEMSSRISLLGVPIDALTASEAISRLKAMLASGAQHHVMTPNNEMLVQASRSKEFHDLLSSTSLNLPDSTGLLFAARLTGQTLPERVTGVDTVISLCDSLSENQTVFLLGAAPGIAERARDALCLRNPNLRIVGCYSGSPSAAEAPSILQKITAAAPQVLFVAFGAPQQDCWIRDHLSSLPSVRIAMGVGGTFDFLAGIQKRAPKVMRVVGLEWLWRFFREPKRYKRMWNAVVVFPYLVLRHGK